MWGMLQDSADIEALVKRLDDVSSEYDSILSGFGVGPGGKRPKKGP